VTGSRSIAVTEDAPRRFHALGVMLAIVSLLIQSFVVQPHIDGLTYVSGAEAAVAHAVDKAPAEHAPGVCVICQEAALSGALTLAATPTLLLVARAFISAPLMALQRALWRAPSHNWQSRAPPHSV
jgi:hypothetical protein